MFRKPKRATDNAQNAATRRPVVPPSPVGATATVVRQAPRDDPDRGLPGPASQGGGIGGLAQGAGDPRPPQGAGWTPLQRTATVSRQAPPGSTQSQDPPATEGYLDPQAEAWLRDLLEPTNTSAREQEARDQQQVALARGRADLDARGGMAGMGLAGGQIALGNQMERESAMGLADQILGIQEGARAEDLQRGALASEMLDRGQQRSADDVWTTKLLEALGYGGEDDEDDPDANDPADPTPSKTPEEDARLEEQYSSVPLDNNILAPFGFGNSPVTSYTEAGTGKKVTVWKRQDGSLYRAYDY